MAKMILGGSREWKRNKGNGKWKMEKISRSLVHWPGAFGRLLSFLQRRTQVKVDVVIHLALLGGCIFMIVYNTMKYSKLEDGFTAFNFFFFFLVFPMGD